jgi:predicted DNA-binding protein (UPF0251 family)
MSRPPKCRRVAFMPSVPYFKPAGIPLRDLEENQLSIEEAESIPTFQRVLTSARKKIADALLNGKAIRIAGGNYEAVALHLICSNGHEWDVQWTSFAKHVPLCPTCKMPPIDSSLPRCWKSGKHRCCREQIEIDKSLHKN